MSKDDDLEIDVEEEVLAGEDRLELEAEIDTFVESETDPTNEPKKKKSKKTKEENLDEMLDLFSSREKKVLVKRYIMDLFQIKEEHIKGKDLRKLHDDALTSHPQKVYEAHGFKPSYDQLQKSYQEIKDNPKYQSLGPLVKYTASLLKNYLDVTNPYSGKLTEKGAKYVR